MKEQWREANIVVAGVCGTARCDLLCGVVAAEAVAAIESDNNESELIRQEHLSNRGRRRASCTSRTRHRVSRRRAPLSWRHSPHAQDRAPESWHIDRRSYNYRVRPGDFLAVILWDHRELSNPASFQTSERVGQRVSPDDTMFFPYAGTIDVDDKTVEEVRVELAERLTSYIKKPQVDVRVIGFRSKRVHVTGAVRTPKDLLITDVPLTPLDPINAAGGPTNGEPAPRIRLREADLDNVRVIRKGHELHLSLLDIYHGRPDENIVLQDGDVVYLSDKRSKEIYVMGEVNKPGLQYPVRDSLSLAAAIQLSGGLNQESANAERIFVIRQGEKQPIVYHLNADDPSGMLLATRFQLAPHDVVFVSSANMARVPRVLTPIVQAAQIASFGSNL